MTEIKDQLLERFLQSDYSSNEDISWIPSCCLLISKLFMEEKKSVHQIKLLKQFTLIVINKYPRAKKTWSFKNRLYVDYLLFSSNLEYKSQDFYQDIIREYPQIIEASFPKDLFLISQNLCSLPKRLITPEITASFIQGFHKFITSHYFMNQNHQSSDHPQSASKPSTISSLTLQLQVVCSLGGFDQLDLKLLNKVLIDIWTHQTNMLLDGNMKSFVRAIYFLIYLKFLGPKDFYQMHAQHIEDFLSKAIPRIIKTYQIALDRPPILIKKNFANDTIELGEYLSELLGVKVVNNKLLDYFVVDFYAELSLQRFKNLFGARHVTESEKQKGTIKLAINLSSHMDFFPTGKLNGVSLFKISLINSMGYRHTFIWKSFIKNQNSESRDKMQKNLIESLATNMYTEVTKTQKNNSLDANII